MNTPETAPSRGRAGAKRFRLPPTEKTNNRCPGKDEISLCSLLPRKRRPESSSTKPGLGSSDVKPSQPPTLSSCQICSFPCWLCNAPRVIPPVLSLAIENRSRSPEGSEWVSRSKSSSRSSCTETSGGEMQEKRKKAREEGLIYLGPKDTGFETHILWRCGVTFRVGSEPVTAAATFGRISHPTQSRVFLKISQEDIRKIAQDFQEYEQQKYDETALAFMVSDSLMLRDNSVDPIEPFALRSLRKEKWRPHLPGPSIPGNTHYYDWDVEPDMTYAVSVNMFDMEIRHQIIGPAGLALLAAPLGVCPYLTIEYKSLAKGGKSSDAQNQVAAASVVWLHQRKQVRSDAGSSDFADVKHYSIIFLSQHVEIWETSCQDDNYLLRRLDEGISLTTVEGVKRYIEWSNGIHAWGLGSYASSFKKDAEKILRGSRKAPGRRRKR